MMGYQNGDGLGSARGMLWGLVFGLGLWAAVIMILLTIGAFR
jgi:hypothetical protein